MSTNPFLLVAGSLSVVTGLAWNDAIQSSISDYFPAKTIMSRFIYACIVTIVVIIFGLFLNYINNTTMQLKQDATSYIQQHPLQQHINL
jgi:uncharacterized BrkB/YihY/UPF0761 family membrane protein